ncbi:MAG: hypothetical protein FWH54_02195 [Methanobrevibacter sp.]|nr:hypothetical protein [Methanobrevibacter sp.]
MVSDEKQQNFPEDIELDYFVDLENIERTQEISFQRQLANHDFEERKIKFKVPECVKEGTKLRIPKEGHIGNGKIGNVFIIIHVKYNGLPSPEGVAHTFKKISYFQAKFGLKVDIHFSKETLRVRIPKKIRNGQILRFKGHGYPNLDLTKRGDLYIKIIIKKPKPYLQFFIDLVPSFFSLLPLLKDKISESIKSLNNSLKNSNWSNNSNNYYNNNNNNTNYNNPHNYNNNNNYNNNFNNFNSFEDSPSNKDIFDDFDYTSFDNVNNNQYNNKNNYRNYDNTNPNTSDSSNSSKKGYDPAMDWDDILIYKHFYDKMNEEESKPSHLDDKYCHHDEGYCYNDEDYEYYDEYDD